MGLLDLLNQLSEENKKEEEKRKQQELENEMEVYGLEEQEKELVRKGEYNPWDFETEGPFEDDDYYKEDEE